MRRIVTAVWLLVLCAATGSTQDSDLASMFAWLAGVWQASDGGEVVEEHWTTPSANMMVGMSRTVAGGRSTAFEFLRIEKRGSDVFYVPQPGGKPATSFKLTSATNGRFVFENTTGEDHVRKIEYRREGENNLHARVEGANGGKPFALEFRYRRLK
jgi:hypothetical protein